MIKHHHFCVYSTQPEWHPVTDIKSIASFAMGGITEPMEGSDGEAKQQTKVSKTKVLPEATPLKPAQKKTGARSKLQKLSARISELDAKLCRAGDLIREYEEGRDQQETTLKAIKEASNKAMLLDQELIDNQREIIASQKGIMGTMEKQIAAQQETIKDLGVLASRPVRVKSEKPTS